MALLESSALLKLPVVTKSGTRLGRVAGFDLDAENQSIVRYRVRPRGLGAGMLKRPLLVAREQVVSIDADKMIVDDNVEKALELEQAKALGLVSEAKA